MHITSRLSPVAHRNADSRASSPINEVLELSPIRSPSGTKPTKQFSYNTGTVRGKHAELD